MVEGPEYRGADKIDMVLSTVGLNLFIRLYYLLATILTNIGPVEKKTVQ
jgi:hypothetical protein